MGSDVTRSTLQALGMQDTRITTDSLWAAESSYTQAGPTAGDPEDQGASAMDITARGTMVADKHLEIVAVEPGMPGPARARYIYREGTSGDYFGHVQYLALVAPWEHILWTDGTSGVVRATSKPHSVTLDDDTVSTVVQATYVSGGTTYRVLSYLRDPDAYTWSPVTVYQQTAAPVDGYWPCQCVLPSGRVLCGHWVEDTTNNLAQVRMHYSDDNGATWAVYSSFVLPEAIDISGVPGAGAAGYELGKLRMVYHAGQVCLVAGLTANNTTPAWREQQWQYASEDDAISFGLVEEFSQQSNPSLAKYWDMVATGTTIVMVSAGTDPDIRRLGSADEPLSIAELVEPTVTPSWILIPGGGGVSTDGDVAICVDEAGTLYIHGRDTGAASEAWCSAIRSTDDGATWTEPGTSPRGPGTWWDAEDGNTHPRDFTTTVQRARVVLCHNWDANPGNEDNSLGAFYLGGYSTLTMPPLYTALTPDQDYASWTRTWLPFDTPDAVGWALVGAGTIALAAGALNIATTANTGYYTLNPTGSIAQGLIVRAVLTVNAGGSVTTDDMAIRLRLADTVDDYDVSIRFNFVTPGFRVYDNNAPGIVGTVTTPGITSFEFVAAISDANFACWYREKDENEEHTWIAGPTSAALTSNVGAPAANHMVRWGHIAASTSESDWTELQYTFASNTGEQLTSFVNPDDLTGREFSATGSYIAEGVTIAAKDGPALIDDEWHIDTAYRYAVENILVGGPRKTWRSTTDGVIETIALALDETLLGTAESMPGNDMVHLTLLGINVRNVLFQRYDVGTAAWVTLVDMSSNTDRVGLHWTRVGNTVIPTGTSGTDNPYLLHNDAKGGTFALGADLRRISWHTEGRFGPGPAKQPTFALEGITGAEGASGATGQIWSSSMCGIAKLNGEKGAAYRLYIPAQSTVDGYYEIGLAIVGHMGVFGRLPDWGRNIELNHGTEQRVARDRTRSARRVAPSQRTVEFTLVDGIDQTEIWTDEAPDYLYGGNTAGKQPVASLRDTPYLLEGQDRYTDGPRLPVVYVPTIPLAVDTVTLVGRHEFIVMTIDAPIRMETILGEENSTEAIRLAQISGREVV